MILKKFILTINLLFLAFVTYSCGLGPSIDVPRVLFFNPDLDISNDYYPFFYSQYSYNEIYYNASSIPNDNIDEWYNYIGGNVDKIDIVNFVYNYSIQDIISDNNIYYWWPHNSFFHALKKRNRDDVIDYIIFAKKVERLLVDDDPWFSASYDLSALSRLIKFAKIQTKSNNDLFLRQRYAYQAIVVMYYLSQYQDVIDFYNDFFEPIPSEDASILKNWAFTYVANSYEFLGDYDTCQKIFLHVLVNSSGKVRMAYQNINKKYLDSIKDDLNTEEYYAYLVAKSIHNLGRKLPALKEIYKYDSECEIFKLLMIRELNKIEHWLFTKKFTSVSYDTADNYSSDFFYAQKLKVFANQIEQNSPSKDKTFWNLYLSDLQYITNDYSASRNSLNKIKNNLNNRAEATQYHILSALLDIQNNNQAAFFNDVMWLNNDTLFDKQNAKSWTNIFVAGYKHYHAIKKYDIAAMYLSYFLFLDDGKWWFSNTWADFYDPFFYLDRYASEQQVKNFMAYNEQINQDNLSKFLLSNYKYDKNRYLDLLGTKRLRKDDLQGALNFYKQINHQFWYNAYEYCYYLNDNPFFSQYLPSFFKTDSNGVAYTNKAVFVEELIHKKKDFSVSSGNKKAILAYQIGNAYANMTYFGRSWLYVCYGKADNGGRLHYTSFDYIVNDNYKTGKQAFYYYDIALKNVKTAYDKTKIFISALGLFFDVNTFVEGELHDEYYAMWLSYRGYTDTLSVPNKYRINFKSELPIFFDKYFFSCRY